MSNLNKLTDTFNGFLEKGEKWLKATNPAQNSLIMGAALSDAGMGAAVGAVGGLFTDQGIVNGALSGAILGAGAGALMKRSQIIEGKAGTERLNRMQAQRAKTIDEMGDLAKREKGLRIAEKASITTRLEKGNWLTGNKLVNKADPRLSSKLDANLSSQKKLQGSLGDLDSSMSAERDALKFAYSKSATGAGAVGGLASLAFATLDSNRM